jgi:cell division protein FtsB
MADEKNKEYLSSVLSITRDQLSRSLAATAEIEALLMLERKRSESLEAKNKELESQISNLQSEKTPEK